MKSRIRKAVVAEVAIPSDSIIRRKEHEKLRKNQELNEELERMLGVKSSVVLVVIETLVVVASKLRESNPTNPRSNT